MLVINWNTPGSVSNVILLAPFVPVNSHFKSFTHYRRSSKFFWPFYPSWTNSVSVPFGIRMLPPEIVYFCKISISGPPAARSMTILPPVSLLPRSSGSDVYREGTSHSISRVQNSEISSCVDVRFRGAVLVVGRVADPRDFVGAHR